MLLRRAFFRGAPLARQSFLLRSNEPNAIHRKDPKTQEISEEFSGVPQEVLDQVAIIGKPPPNSMQSLDYFNYWEVRFPEGRTWNESLMGWTKSDNTSRWARQLMKFNTREAAVAFCERNALSYQVENEQPVIYNKKNYGDKFKFRATKKEDVDIV
eukprot:Phypoly_transcript_24647.p1 GENE.Phypoly_transcript_24647~~Phypoly_transcript_24647.p1  ORF type:complete len:156 (+),score=21.55 Phypoly_transcript_24647:45-512(+)